MNQTNSVDLLRQENKPSTGHWVTSKNISLFGMLHHGVQVGPTKVIAVTGVTGSLDSAESDANAALIADAGNVFNTTGMTPSQLVGLLVALQDIAEYTGEGPVHTDWQGIVRAMSTAARRAIAATKLSPPIVLAPETPKATSSCGGHCVFVADPQPDNEHQSKCSKCGETTPF